MWLKIQRPEVNGHCRADDCQPGSVCYIPNNKQFCNKSICSKSVSYFLIDSFYPECLIKYCVILVDRKHELHNFCAIFVIECYKNYRNVASCT